MKVIGVIPARYDSTRFPGKPLADILGKTMIQYVYEAASKSSLLDRVIVATDDRRIFDKCVGFGADVMMTSREHPSGSDRAAEVAEKTDGDIYVNIQGDEPLLPPANIDLAVKPLLDDDSIMMSTLKTDFENADELFDVNIVKVVTDSDDYALYFSRLPLPFIRESGVTYHNAKEMLEKNNDLLTNYYAQIGLYAFRRDFLFKFTSLSPSGLEQLEKLEQLRAMENGYKIKVIYTAEPSVGVDSPADLDRIISIIEKGNHGN
jgi:3-deoxy-manno-octulosonate cytidylyltransferase (CMP-KDO synthetase)